MRDDRVGGGAARPARNRSVILALVLSGLGPGAGHLYVSQGRRGTLLVLLWIASFLAWTTQAASSWSAFRFWALPWILALLAVIVDSGRLAARAPRPFHPGRLQKWWLYALVVVVTGWAVPMQLTAALVRQVGLVTVSADDESMQPWIHPLDRVVFDRRVRDVAAGDVVVVAGQGGEIMRRVVGLPGQRVEARAGRVVVDGHPWIHDPARLSGGSRLRIPPLIVAPGSVLVLSDRRDASEAATWRMARADVIGRATWLLLPSDLDPLRVGAPVR